jgi:peptidylprolyl isomerase/FKBP-type peptidyl-prolyl cis-trans isomerase FkpA
MGFVNTRLAVFIIAFLLILGAVVVFAKNNFKPTGSNSENSLYKLDTIQGPRAQQASPTMNEPQITELKIEDEKEGTGSAVVKGDKVEVNYIGTLLNGVKFDSSYDHGQTFSFTVGGGQVIEGWDQGLIGMKTGGKRKLTIPSSMAYGSQAVGGIPANSPLIFEIELVKIN